MFPFNSLDVLFPFGVTEGDTGLSDVSNSLDDSSSPSINLSQPFTFFKEMETTLYV